MDGPCCVRTSSIQIWGGGGIVHLALCIPFRVTQEHQLKSKLNKQLREREDYILQVLAQKRKLEEQLNKKEKEHISLQQVG